MYIKDIQGYISLVYPSSTEYAGFDGKSLDILEQFAWERYLSAYQIHSNIKFTYLKMAYKNVNKWVNALLLSGLLQKFETDSKISKHKAIYYRLTEKGIYQLFLNRLNSLLVNQSDVRKGTPPNALSFFQNYSDSMLFETFLYPYFEKDTLLAIGSRLLWDLYGYLSSCCQSIERKVKHFELGDTQIHEKIFSLNQIPGKDDELLLSHLQQILKLESTEGYKIKKEEKDGTITVNRPSASPIVIKLDEARIKAVMMFRTSNDEFEEMEYVVHKIGKELVVSRRMRGEESMQDIVNEAEERIEQLIHKFVYHLPSETHKEFSYYREILSKDGKFMTMVKKIHEDSHKGFEIGYMMLMNNE
jgi:hypothetical protein